MIKHLEARHDCREMSSDEIVELILDDRGIDDIISFLKPDESSLIDFNKMNGLQEAYEIVDDAIAMGDKFLLLSDVDVDGCTSSAIIYRYLQMAGANVDCTINKGKKHGAEDFDLSLLDDIDVMIIVDSLNNNPSVYKRITDTGTKLIILDHHLVEDRLLESKLPFVLVTSAKDYQNEELSGAGVCLKFVLFCDEQNLTDYAESLWVYAAIGIVADMSSMASEENRYIVSRGLAQFQNPVVKKMIGNYLFNTESIQFSIAPLVNSAMRMSENEKAMNVFLTDDEGEIDELVKDLKKCKEEQNKYVDSLMEDLLRQGEEQINKKCMFFFIQDVEAEVTGLVGNRCLSLYQRPLFILKDCGDKFCGSMRAIGTENFLGMCNSTGLCLCQGHPSAAGAFIDKDKFEEFCNVIEKELEDIEFSIDVVADIEITTNQINDYLIKQLGTLNKISGKGFEPITVLIRTDDYEVSTFSSKKHLKVIDNETGVIFVSWNDMAWQTMKNDKQFVGVGKISSAYYGRTKYIQLVMDNYTQID